MKIAINNKRVHHYDSLSYKSKLAAREMGAEKAGQNRDRVFIGSDASQSDKLIAGEAAHKVIQEAFNLILRRLPAHFLYLARPSGA